VTKIVRGNSKLQPEGPKGYNLNYQGLFFSQHHTLGVLIIVLISFFDKSMIFCWSGGGISAQSPPPPAPGFLLLSNTKISHCSWENMMVDRRMLEKQKV
jgi:hypothetical protein